MKGSSKQQNGSSDSLQKLRKLKAEFLSSSDSIQTKLELVVQKIDKQLSEARRMKVEYLRKGLLGSHKDTRNLIVTLEAQRTKLLGSSTEPNGLATENVDEAAESDSDCVEEDDLHIEKHFPAASPLSYRWRIAFDQAWLYVSVARGDDVTCDLSERRVRVSTVGNSLNLPLPFAVNCEAEAAVYRRKTYLSFNFRPIDGMRRSGIALARDLVERTWGIIDNFLPPRLADRLHADTLEWRRTGMLPPGETHVGVHAARTDLAACLEAEESPSLARATHMVDELVAEIYGKVDALSQTHLERERPQVAIYPEGAKYDRHFDGRSGDKTGRVLTVLLYLNPWWQESAGGKLRIYSEAIPGESVDVEPLHGRLLAFLCHEKNSHEVLQSFIPRAAITLWYADRKLLCNADVPP